MAVVERPEASPEAMKHWSLANEASMSEAGNSACRGLGYRALEPVVMSYDTVKIRKVAEATGTSSCLAPVLDQQDCGAGLAKSGREEDDRRRLKPGHNQEPELARLPEAT